MSPDNEKSHVTHQQQKCRGNKVSDVRFNTRTEGLTQLTEDSHAEVTARYEARLEAVWHMVKEAERKAEAEEMNRKVDSEAAEREAEAARLAKLEAEMARLQAEVVRVKSGTA